MSVRCVPEPYPDASVRRAMRTSGELPAVDAKHTKIRRLVTKSGASWKLIIPASDATSRSAGLQWSTTREPSTIVSPFGRSVYTSACAGLAFAGVQPTSHGKFNPVRVELTESGGAGRHAAHARSVAATRAIIRGRIPARYPGRPADNPRPGSHRTVT